MSGQMYNNPRPLYSEDNLADIPANAGFVQVDTFLENLGNGNFSERIS